MSVALPNRLAAYVPTLRGCDEILRQRVVLHDFGLVGQSADRDARFALAEEELLVV